MKKYIITIAAIVLSFSVYANDVDDINYINKLYLNKYYKESIMELEIFLKKYPNSKFYNSAQNLLAYNYFTFEKYSDAQNLYKKLKTSEFKDEALYYLTVIASKQNDDAAIDANLKEANLKKEMGQKLVIFAGKYYEEKKYEEKAIEQYKKLLSSQSSYRMEAMLNLGMVYFNLSDYLKSSVVLEEYILLDNQNVDDLVAAYYMLAYSNNKIGETNSAINKYEKIVTEYKSSSYYLKSIYNLMVIYYNQKNTEKAYSYASLLIGSEYEEQALEFSAKIYYEKGNYAKSEEIYKELWSKYSNKEIFFKYILSMLKQDKTDAAAQVLSNFNIKSETEKGFITEYYYYSMFILFNQKKYDLVLEKMGEISVENIENTYIEDIYRFAADSAFINTKFDIALNYYQKLFDIRETEKYLQRIIISAYKEKNYPVLDNSFVKYSSEYGIKSSLSRDAYLSFGNSKVERKELDDAEKVYSEYLIFREDNIIKTNLITVLLDLKKYDKALALLEKSEPNDENNYLKATAYSGLGRNEEAEKIYDKLLSKPGEVSEQSYSKIIDALFAQEKYDKVFKYCDLYLEKGKKVNKEYVLDIKGKAYLKLRKYDEAIKIYSDLIKTSKTPDYAYFMTAEVYYNAKKYDESKRYYQYVLDKFTNSEYRMVSLYWIVNIDYILENSNLVLKNGEHFIKLYPESSFTEELLLTTAEVYASKKMYTNALTQYEKAYALTKKDDIKNNIAIDTLSLLLNLKRYISMNTWVERVTDAKEKMLWQAITAEKTGSTDEAVKLYEQLTSDEEVGDRANYFLGNLYFEKGNYEKSRSYLEGVLNFSESEYKDDAVVQIGLSFEAEKNYQRAVSSFIRIKLIYEGSPLQEFAEIKIAENYKNLGEFEKAAQAYIEFIENNKGSEYYSRALTGLLDLKVKTRDTESVSKYYKELKSIDEKAAQEYDIYFKN